MTVVWPKGGSQRTVENDIMMQDECTWNQIERHIFRTVVHVAGLLLWMEKYKQIEFINILMDPRDKALVSKVQSRERNWIGESRV